MNATKLCKEDINSKTPNGKRFDNWLANQSSQEILDVLFEQLNGITREEHEAATGKEYRTFIEPIHKVTSGSQHETELRGTYVHPNLLPNILIWLGKTHNQIRDFISRLGQYGIVVNDITSPKKKSTPNLLYHVTITSSKGLIHKIGITTDIDQRMKSYNNRYHLEEVTLVKCRETEKAKQIESSICSRFIPISNKEYFLLSDSELEEFDNLFLRTNDVMDFKN